VLFRLVSVGKALINTGDDPWTLAQSPQYSSSTLVLPAPLRDHCTVVSKHWGKTELAFHFFQDIVLYTVFHAPAMIDQVLVLTQSQYVDPGNIPSIVRGVRSTFSSRRCTCRISIKRKIQILVRNNESLLYLECACHF